MRGGAWPLAALLLLIAVPAYPQVTEPVPFAWPVGVAPFAHASAFLWVVSAALLALWRPRESATRRSAAVGGLLALAIGGLAAAIRASAPFWALHSNGHAEHDIAIALRLGGIASERELTYGPAWVIAQQAMVWCWGTHRAGVALAAVTFGAVASALVTWTCWSLTRSVWPALVGGLFMATVPAVGRVAHSESPFVVSQFLVALVLLHAAGRPGRVRWLGTGTALVLLAWGHPLGIGYAVGATGVAWAVIGTDPSGTRRTTLGMVVSGTVIALAWLLWHSLHGGIVEQRMSLPLTQYLQYSMGNSLWRSRLWVSPLWLVVAFAGTVAVIATAPSPRRWAVGLALALGALALVRVGTLPIACASDALRYQAPWAAPVALFAGLACHWPPGGRVDPRWSRGLVITATVVALLYGLRDRRMWSVLDAQGRRTASILHALKGQQGDVPLLAGSTDGRTWPHAYSPVGRLDAHGPTLIPLQFDLAQALCTRGGRLPPQTTIIADRACPPEDAGECAALQSWQRQPQFAIQVPRLSTAESPTVRPEFSASFEGMETVLVGPAGCPGR